MNREEWMEKKWKEQQKNKEKVYWKCPKCANLSWCEADNILVICKACMNEMKKEGYLNGGRR